MSPTLQLFLYPVSPVLALWLAACLIIVLEFFPGLRLQKVKSAIALGAALCSLLFTISLWKAGAGGNLLEVWGASAQPAAKWITEFLASYRLDNLSLAFYGGISVFTMLALLFMESPFSDHPVQGEILTLVLFVASGMMLLVSADSLLMAFLALELLSLPTYVLVGIRRSDRESTEAALKYFLFGSFASVLFVFGIALIYGQFGTLRISALAPMVASLNTNGGSPILLIGGMVLLSVAAAFKVGVVPFHMWVPDVYQGAPASITGFMGAAIKMAGFGLVLRFFWEMFLPISAQWVPVISWLAIATMYIGNIAALAQDNLKRLFAYSSISHAGYLLVGLTAAAGHTQAPSAGPVFYYLLVYGLMFLGLLACLSVIEQTTGSSEIYQLSGLGQSHPLLAFCIAVFAISGAGIPPTAGFFAKYFLFLEAVRAGHVLLVVLAVISSLIGAYYYLRVLVYLYMKDSKEKVGLKPGVAYAGILLCVLSLFFFSVTPTAFGIGALFP